jgi:hypothetical protein
MNTTKQSAHNEWLVDEAIRQTFPASDPISPSQPGSLVSERYAAHHAATLRNVRNTKRALWWLACGCAAVYALWLTSRRLRGRPNRGEDRTSKSSVSRLPDR